MDAKKQPITWNQIALIAVIILVAASVLFYFFDGFNLLLIIAFTAYAAIQMKKEQGFYFKPITELQSQQTQGEHDGHF